jgi:nucleoside-diphosphate-sugar epimerase
MSAVGAMQRALGRESELSSNAAGMTLRRGTYSIAKAQRMLGYEPAVGLDEGMARTQAWLRESGLL